ncbi:putative F-box protein PP2-B12 [Nymphaea colorata]|nr:putative F-box protein PP2-B12 [Nymphaea colorata]
MASNPPRSSASIVDLPENCVSHVLSLMAPREVCRSSAVSMSFQSAANSDYVWEKVLPPDLPELLSRAVSPVCFSSKKELFFRLCSSPIIIDSGKRSFWLDKSSGKKCFMLSARELSIVWGDDNRYWKWVTLPDSRFSEVVELLNVCWLEVRGSIKASELSPHTQYAAYFILKHTDHSYGFHSHQAEFAVSVSDGSRSSKRKAFIHSDKHGPITARFSACGRRFGSAISFRPRGHLMTVRPAELLQSELHPRAGGNGEWMEIEIGEFYVGGDEDGAKVEFSMMEVNGGHWKSGLVLEGIEIRPKTKPAN